MAEPTDAPAPAPTGESEQTPTPTNNEPAKAPEQKVEAPDMHGFTSEQLAEMKKFYDANGGFEKVKSKISNPEKPADKPAEEPQKKEEPTSHTQVQPEDVKKMGMTNDDIIAKYYFESLSKQEKYAPIAKEIESGEVLKEMANLGIQFKYPDGSWNRERINDYLDLRAKTVPAKPTESEPNMSSAPTVDYVNVGDNIENIDQAYKVIMQPGHPAMAKAEEFIKSHLNPNSQKKQ